MIAVVKKSQHYKDKIQKIVITINAPILVRYQACNIQWEWSTYSRFGETWDLFSSMDYELFALDRINKETITLNVRIDILFICPVCIEAFAAISSTSYISHLLPLISSHETVQVNLHTLTNRTWLFFSQNLLLWTTSYVATLLYLQ